MPSCSQFVTDLRNCARDLEKAVTLTPGGKSIYFSHEATEDLFFTTGLASELRITGNLARHFQLKLFLRDKKSKTIIKEIKPNEEAGFEIYHQFVPYPFLSISLQYTEQFDTMGFELLGQITHVTDHVWSLQVSNFSKHERNEISGEYVGHKVDIPIPVQSYIRVDKLSDLRTEKVPANIFSMYFKGGADFTLKKGT